MFQDFINRENKNKATCGERVCADRQGVSFVGFCSHDFLAGQSGEKLIDWKEKESFKVSMKGSEGTIFPKNITMEFRLNHF